MFGNKRDCKTGSSLLSLLSFLSAHRSFPSSLLPAPSRPRASGPATPRSRHGPPLACPRPHPHARPFPLSLTDASAPPVSPGLYIATVGPLEPCLAHAHFLFLICRMPLPSPTPQPPLTTPDRAPSSPAHSNMPPSSAITQATFSRRIVTSPHSISPLPSSPKPRSHFPELVAVPEHHR